MIKTFEALCRFYLEHGWAPTHDELAELTDQGINTIWRHMAKLQDMGYIVVRGHRQIQFNKWLGDYNVNAS